MRRWLPFVIPFVLVLSGGLVAWAATSGVLATKGLPDGPPVYTTFDALDGTVPYARISGMAHYDVVVTQTVPATLFREEQVFYVFGLFAPYDTTSRTIRILVRTPRAPERYVSYELMTLEGAIERATPEKIPWDVEIALGERSDYYFADDLYLMEPVTIEEGLDPRVPTGGE